MQIYTALNRDLYIIICVLGRVVVPEMVAGVEPECWYGHNHTVQSLHKAEDQLGLELLGVKILIRAENTELSGHFLGQNVHPILFIFRQISNGKNMFNFQQ